MSKKESQEFNSLGNGKNSIYENRIGLSHNDIEFDLFNPSNENLYKKENLSDAKMKKIQKNASLASKTASVLIATFTAASIGVSGVTSILPPQEKASIEIFAEEDYVSYFVEIEGYKDGQVYTVTIHNDFTNRKQEFVDGAIEGFEEGLKPHMYYIFSVKKGNKLIAQKSFVTESQRQKSDDYNQDELYPFDGNETDNPRTQDDNSEEKPVIEDDNPNTEPNDPTTGGN